VTRFVAALLIARGHAVIPMADPRTPVRGRPVPPGPFGPGQQLAEAFARGRKQRQEGMEAIRCACDAAWEIHQQEGEGE